MKLIYLNVLIFSLFTCRVLFLFENKLYNVYAKKQTKCDWSVWYFFLPSTKFKVHWEMPNYPALISSTWSVLFSNESFERGTSVDLMFGYFKVTSPCGRVGDGL